MMLSSEKILSAFHDHFGTRAEKMILTPGRVNIIGEHTDYNDGFVLPMAINRCIQLAMSARDDHIIQICAHNFKNQILQFDLQDLHNTKQSWGEYVKGMAWVLQNEFNTTLHGFNACINSDIPIGAGLSSSAAFELTIARALTDINQLPWDATKMALLAQRAENQWVGVNCGIMDQLICARGQKDHALLIDCRSLHTQALPLPTDTVIVIMDTATRRGLVESAYNERRHQCEQAADFFHVNKLRDVTLEQLQENKDRIDPIVYRRAHHVITENNRTLAAKNAMQQNDAQMLGELMRASHVSLRDDYAVSSPALDCIVNHANAHSACFGARMTGAGFGGCAVALVQHQAIDDFVAYVTEHYQQDQQLTPLIYVTPAEGGVSLNWVSNYH